MNDPKTAWQNQPTELPVMTPQKMRQKAQELHSRTRRALLGGMIAPLLVVGIAAWIIAQVDSGLVVRAAFAISIAWSLAGQYFLNRGMWSEALSVDVAPSTGIESYRREVERRRSLSERYLLWSLGPVVLGIATFVVPLLRLGIRKGMLIDMIPFLALLVIWIVGVLIVRMRQQRELRNEIDELKVIEKGNKC